MNVFISLTDCSWGFLTVKSNLNQLADKHGPLEINCPELFSGKFVCFLPLILVELKESGKYTKENKAKSVSLADF